MSDVLPCPKCRKYIDTTFGVDVCPKCGAMLKGVELTNIETFTDDELNRIDTHLPGSIASVIFCMPLGVIAVIFSILTIRDKRKRDYSSALSHSSLAHKFLLAGIGTSIIIFTLNLIGRLGRHL